ncbi:hypothetical protein UF75_2449 [Desulfosporosinus sp. I2]|uniref:2-dehydropantoate 2-reductase N-terminal domain-containing protein n=1 Tax=Desulfosporosinus sp. I2 TaxID=1617025 RepID=UPI0005EFFE01|nr:2-dehydropantoate 2-reductase N-terminal domain-containing protein [Desulfosporosinus sp. I2]KJR47152.1 hypothetical protein UF75_2449 [Desulfosporosinus sp. I2]
MNEKLVKQEITVVGTGAIGGVLAAYLARNGERETCVDVAEEHVLTMNPVAMNKNITGFVQTPLGNYRFENLDKK